MWHFKSFICLRFCTTIVIAVDVVVIVLFFGKNQIHVKPCCDYLDLVFPRAFFCSLLRNIKLNVKNFHVIVIYFLAHHIFCFFFFFSRSFRCSFSFQPCPEAQDFRAHQCAAFDDVPYDGSLFKWTPHYDYSEPCALTCR